MLIYHHNLRLIIWLSPCVNGHAIKELDLKRTQLLHWPIEELIEGISCDTQLRILGIGMIDHLLHVFIIIRGLDWREHKLIQNSIFVRMSGKILNSSIDIESVRKLYIFLNFIMFFLIQQINLSLIHPWIMPFLFLSFMIDEVFLVETAFTIITDDHSL